MNFEKLINPLRLELKRGCNNDAVIGGLDKFILKSLTDLDDANLKRNLEKLFKDYDKRTSEERKIIIGECLSLIESNLKKDNPIRQPKISNEVENSLEKTKLSELFIPVQYVKGVGPELAKKLNKLRITTAYDLLMYFPREYLDLRDVKKIVNLTTGENALLKVRIRNIEEKKGKLNILTVLVTDGTGFITAVWFNQGYLKKIFKVGMELYLYGKVQFSYGKWEMPSPAYEIVEEGKEPLNALRITPIYSLTEGLYEKVMRSKIKNFIDSIPYKIFDYIDKQVLERNNLVDLDFAIRNIHFPQSFQDVSKSKKRLIFNELFELQYLLLNRKKTFKKLEGYAFKTEDSFIEEFSSLLPFELTSDQVKAMSHILNDFSSHHPMNRLIHGDVGSGKTVVALFASYVAYKNGFQSAIMSPTEILAEQTFENALNIFKNLNMNIALLTSSTKRKEKLKILDDLQNGNIDLIIGTHALIEEDVLFKKLGLVVVDEQHRFGVMQRGALKNKAIQPHTLVMSATPIPRTLALTLYGDLDISEIRVLPKGRKPVITKVFLNDEESPYSLVQEELNKGHKAYIVCPLIEDSDLLEVKSVETLFDKLENTHLKNYKIAKLHGAMSSIDKQEVIDGFKNGDIQAIVSTTVVEVGVDVKDATVIVVEDADRFGLATLHQLRGRVGRSDLQSYCLLIVRNPSKESVERLRILEKTNNGFEVAEEDLHLRGPGEIFGTKQSGLSNLHLYSLLQEDNMTLLEKARKEAMLLINKETTWEEEHVEELKRIISKKYEDVILLIEVS